LKTLEVCGPAQVEAGHFITASAERIDALESLVRAIEEFALKPSAENQQAAM
jgi:hypothetical protein